MTPIANAVWLAQESFVSAAGWHDDIRQRALARGQHGAWKPSPRWRLAIFLLVLALTLAALLLLRTAMQSRRAADIDVLHVALFDAIAPEPALPEPTVKPRSALKTVASSRAEPSTPFRVAETAPAEPTNSPAAMPRVFNVDGSIRLPVGHELQGHELQGHDADIERGRELLARGHNMLHCRRGQFASRPSPEEIANKAAGGLAMYLTMFQSPSGDPKLREVGAAQQIAGVREIVAAKLAAADQACDDPLYGPPPMRAADRQALQ